MALQISHVIPLFPFKQIEIWHSSFFSAVGFWKPDKRSFKRVIFLCYILCRLKVVIPCNCCLFTMGYLKQYVACWILFLSLLLSWCDIFRLRWWCLEYEEFGHRRVYNDNIVQGLYRVWYWCWWMVFYYSSDKCINGFFLLDVNVVGHSVTKKMKSWYLTK